MAKPNPNKIFRQAALDKLASPEELDQTVQITNRRGWIALLGALAVLVAALVWAFLGSVPVQLQANGILVRENGIAEILSPQAGQITALNVKSGDVLEQGFVIGKVRSNNGIETEIKAPFRGPILEVNVEKGSIVDTTTLIASLERSDQPLKALLIVPLSQSKQLATGLTVQLAPSFIRPEEAGYLLGTISFVSSLPVSPENLYLQLHNKTLANALSSNTLAVQVEVTLENDPGSFSGYKWTTPKGPRITLSSETLCQGEVELSQQRPISLLLPILQGDYR